MKNQFNQIYFFIKKKNKGLFLFLLFFFDRISWFFLLFRISFLPIEVGAGIPEKTRARS